MANVNNVHGEERIVPWVGFGSVVADGATMEVPDEELASWLEGGWEPADADTRAAADKLAADGKTTVWKVAPKTKGKKAAPDPAPDDEVKADAEPAEEGKE